MSLIKRRGHLYKPEELAHACVIGIDLASNPALKEAFRQAGELFKNMTYSARRDGTYLVVRADLGQPERATEEKE